MFFRTRLKSFTGFIEEVAVYRFVVLFAVACICLVLAGSAGAQTFSCPTGRLFTYQYGCDTNYGNCTDKEVFSLGSGVGLYDWKHYVNQNGQWVFAQESPINNKDVGHTTPYFPCPNTYQ